MGGTAGIECAMIFNKADSWLGTDMQRRSHCSPDPERDSSPVSTGRADGTRWRRRRRRRGVGLDDRARQPAAGRGRPRSDRSSPPTSHGFGSRPRPRQSPPRFAWPRPGSKAALKFEHGQQMWVEPTAVEQATVGAGCPAQSQPIPCPLVVDLCAGIGGDALALAARSDVLAVDLDQGMCRRLRYNASVYDVADRVLPVRARAEAFAIPAGAWLHLDPDRRASRSTACSIARWITLPGPISGSRPRGESPPGRSSSARPAISPSTLPARNTRSS